MYRTPLGSALIANWQYLALASGPLSGDPGSLGSQEAKLRARLWQTRSLPSGARSPERSSNRSTNYKGGCSTPSFVSSHILKLSISGDATRFPPTQPGALALA